MDFNRVLPNEKNTYPSTVIRNECAPPRRTLRALSHLNILRHFNTSPAVVDVNVVVVIVVAALGEFLRAQGKKGDPSRR